MTKKYLEKRKGNEPSSFLVDNNTTSNRQFLNLSFNEPVEYIVDHPFNINWTEFANNSRVVAVPTRGTAISYETEFEELGSVGFSVERNNEVIASSTFNFKVTPRSPLEDPKAESILVTPQEVFIGSNPPQDTSVRSFIKDEVGRYTGLSSVQDSANAWGQGRTLDNSLRLRQLIGLLVGINLSEYDPSKNYASLRKIRRYIRPVKRINESGGQITAAVSPYEEYSIPQLAGGVDGDVMVITNNSVFSPNIQGELSQEPGVTYEIWTMCLIGGLVPISGRFPFTVPQSGGLIYRTTPYARAVGMSENDSPRTASAVTLTGGALVKLVGGVPQLWSPIEGNDFSFVHTGQRFDLTRDPDRPIATLADPSGEHHVAGINQTRRPIIGYTVIGGIGWGSDSGLGVQLRDNNNVLGVAGNLSEISNSIEITESIKYYYRHKVSVTNRLSIPAGSEVFAGVLSGTQLTRVRSVKLNTATNTVDFGDVLQNFIVSPTNVSVPVPVFSAQTTDSINTAITVNNLTTTTSFQVGDVIKLDVPTQDVQYIGKLAVTKAT